MCLFDGSPAKASARLQTWQFDTTQNRLFFLALKVVCSLRSNC